MQQYEKMTKAELIQSLRTLHATADSDIGESQQLVHELQVHQVELEMQNRELREAQQALEESRNRYAHLYDFSPAAYVTLTDAGLIEEINLTATSLLGQFRSRLNGKPFSHFVAPPDAPKFLRHLRLCRETETKVITELALATSGGTLPVQLSSIQTQDDAGRRYRTAITDLTLLKQAEQQLRAAHDELERRVEERTQELVTTNMQLTAEIAERKIAQHLAEHDMLTNLPNRMLLEDRAEQAMLHVNRDHHLIALLFIDLDNFKQVNDSLGHRVGDLLLVETARRLSACLREEDTVARQGGDEFIALIHGLKAAQEATLVAEKILACVTLPFIIEEHEIHLSCSIGISLYPGDARDFEAMLRHADTAMYVAKQSGRNNYQFCTKEMIAVGVRFPGASDLRLALERAEFVLHYQPQVSLSSGEIVGMEALIRWQHAELGTIAPEKFIPIAENTGLIGPIGEWALTTACRQNKAWQDAGHAPLRVAVNMSSRQFKRSDLLDRVLGVLRQTGLDPRHLALEITESVMMQRDARTIAVLNSLRAMGVELIMDDFGTGFSGLSNLKTFPLDKIKIDRSFVQGITTDPHDAAIISSIISLAHNLGLKVVAEGVETEVQMAHLQRQGCDEAQGFYFDKPLPASEFAALSQPPSAGAAMPRYAHHVG